MYSVMGKQFREWNVEQSYLLPASVKDFVPSGHLSHFIRDLVLEELDLSMIYESYEEERGYPPYNPSMMVSLLLYSYSQGVYSSRKISRACEERLDFMAVSAMNKPNFRTISKFRKRHLSSLGALFVQVLKLCESAGLVKLGHVCLDGSKVKANASKEQSKNYKRLKEDEQRLKEEIDRWFQEAEAADVIEDDMHGEQNRGDELPDWVKSKEARLAKIKEARETLEQEHQDKQKAREQAEKDNRKPRSKTKKQDMPKDTKSYNFTDPDSQRMRSRQGYIVIGLRFSEIRLPY